MAFTIQGSNSSGPVSFTCATASDAVDKVLELERQRYENIAIKDDTGRSVGLDELSDMCEAGED